MLIICLSVHRQASANDTLRLRNPASSPAAVSLHRVRHTGQALPERGLYIIRTFVFRLVLRRFAWSLACFFIHTPSRIVISLLQDRHLSRANSLACLVRFPSFPFPASSVLLGRFFALMIYSNIRVCFQSIRCAAILVAERSRGVTGKNACGAASLRALIRFYNAPITSPNSHQILLYGPIAVRSTFFRTTPS